MSVEQFLLVATVSFAAIGGALAFLLIAEAFWLRAMRERDMEGRPERFDFHNFGGE